jgi:formylglycine-generating enzyme required for sulfatase activity
MHGNVWEWCSGWYEEKYPSGSVVDPAGPAGGTLRVLRGGSWGSGARYVRSADRGWLEPDDRYVNFGFRFAQGHKAAAAQQS